MIAAGASWRHCRASLSFGSIPALNPHSTRKTREMNAFKHLMQRGAAALLALSMALLFLVQAQQVHAETVHGITANGIFSVDSVSGGPATQLVTFATSLASPATLATRPSDGMLFYLDSNIANPNLWRWDPANPSVMPVLVGTPGTTTTGVIRLGFDVFGNLFAMNRGVGTLLWKLDPNTGGILSVTPVSGFNGGDIPGGGDLCLHPSTGVLYMVAQANLFTVSSSGLVTLVGAMTGLPIIGPATSPAATGCAFDRNGKLIVSPSDQLYSVNIGTLVATALPNPTGVPAFGDLATNPDPSVRSALRLSKVASNVTPGSTVSFTVTVTNDGPSRATDVRVLDLLPTGLTLISSSASQGIYSATAVVGPPAYPAGTWRVGTLNNGAVATLTITANVTGPGPIINYAQVSYADQYDPNSTPGSTTPFGVLQNDQASVTITPSPDLRTVKTATSSFAVGTNATYSITVNNTLGSLTTGASTYTVTDVLPTGLTFESAAGTGWTCAANTPAAGDNVVGGSRMVCTSSATMIAGASNTNAITLTVKPAAAAAPTVVNVATVSGGGEPASNNGNNSSTISTPVCSASGCPDLRVTKTAGTSLFVVGTAASYTLSVSNIGGLATDANNYVISDTLPAGLTLTTAIGGAGWTIGAGWTCTVGAVGGNQVTCNSSTSIAPGGVSSAIEFPVTVANNAAPSVANTASVTGGGEPAAFTGNNSTTLTTPVTAFDLTILKTKTVADNFVLGVSTDTYTLTASNIGAVATTGTITVTDTLPAGLTLTTASGGTGWTTGANWTCSGAAGGNVVSCTRTVAIAALDSNVAVVIFPVTVAAAAAPSVSNTAAISNPNESINLLGNNSSTLVTPVNAPDLVVTKSHNGDFTVGVNNRYTITVSNLGKLTTSAANVVVTDVLPIGLTYVSGTGTNWTCAVAGVAPAQQTVTCTRLAANAIIPNASTDAITLTVTPTATAAINSPVTNNVSVSGGNEPAGNVGLSADPNVTDNNDTDRTDVYLSPPTVTKTFTPAAIAPGGTSSMVITVTNPVSNGVNLTGVSIGDNYTGTLQNNAVGTVSCTGVGSATKTGGVNGGTSVGFNLGTIVSGGTCTITQSVTATTSTVNTTTAPTATGPVALTGTAASATLPLFVPMRVTKSFGTNPVANATTSSLLTITLFNDNPVAATGVAFNDVFPNNAEARNAPVTTCSPGTATSSGNGVLTAAFVALANGTIPAAVGAVPGSCTVTVNVRGVAGAAYTNTIPVGGVTSTNGVPANTVAATDKLVVGDVLLNKKFLASLPLTGTVNLEFTASYSATGQTFSFTDTLPSGLVVAAAFSRTCTGGSVVAAVNGSTIVVTNNVNSAAVSCTITVPVKVSGTPAIGNCPQAGNTNNNSNFSSLANVQAGVSDTIDGVAGGAPGAGACVSVVAPSLIFLKTVAVLSDPVNGVTNPKNIPGAEVLYTLRVTNTGPGTVDLNSTVVSDPISLNTNLFVGDLSGAGTGPIQFVQGTPTSGLSWTYAGLSSATDDIGFYSDSGCTTLITPTPSAALPPPAAPGPYDALVRCIRLNPKGVMTGTGGGNPSFELKFKVLVK